MDKITEEHIEKFVRFPDSLTQTEKKEVRKAISNSQELQDLANWFRSFYKELDDIGKAGKKHVISLVPFQHHSDTNAKHHPLILAAKSKKRKRDSLETLATFVSKEERTVVRVLYKHSEEKYQIHLIREGEPEEDELFILSVNGITDFVIDKRRHITFDSSSKLDAIDWENITLSLRSPIGFFKLGSQELNKEIFGKPLLKNGFQIEQKKDDQSNSIMVKKSVSTKEITRILIERESAEYEIYHFGLENSLQISFERGQQDVNCWVFE
nr:hypothetical protein 5 [Balneolaceae bacterium]